MTANCKEIGASYKPTGGGGGVLNMYGIIVRGGINEGFTVSLLITCGKRLQLPKVKELVKKKCVEKKLNSLTGCDMMRLN